MERACEIKTECYRNEKGELVCRAFMELPRRLTDEEKTALKAFLHERITKEINSRLDEALLYGTKKK